MRIAVVNNFFPPRVGGSSHLSDALAIGYAAAGHEVVVITATYRDAPAYEERDGLKIFRLQAVPMPATRLAISFDMAFTTRPSLKRRLAEILDAFSPDVIHQHGQFFDLSWATGRYARSRAIPVLLSVHTRLESPTPSYARIFHALDALVVAPELRRYKPTFVVMDSQMERYINRRYRRAISGRAHIPVGVELDRGTHGDAQRVRDKHRLDEHTPVILSLGHVIQMRDRVALVEALPLIRQKVPDAKVLIVGAVHFPKFETRAQELGVSDMIVSVGAVPGADVADYLAAAWVESHDLQGYGLGTASLEAMAAGVPVVAAVRHDNFGSVELSSGTDCWLVDVDDPEGLADALTTALTDVDASRAVGAAGRELVRRHFRIEAVVTRHLEVLSALVASSA
ncbi:MAG TPA: glycosyltransferase family 4 protein [Jatrophihabitans sp.]|jgi:glycosyltransferase involved in cell wall biosynthesis